MIVKNNKVKDFLKYLEKIKRKVYVLEHMNIRVPTLWVSDLEMVLFKIEKYLLFMKVEYINLYYLRNLNMNGKSNVLKNLKDVLPKELFLLYASIGDGIVV